jgi:hypothetical protein
MLIPEFCIKINEKLGLYLMDQNHFISLLFMQDLGDILSHDPAHHNTASAVFLVIFFV